MTSPLITTVKTALERLAPRERQMVVVALGLLSVSLVWWLALAPALQTLRSSDAAHAKLDTELAQMQALAIEAKQLKTRPSMSPKDAENWLAQSVKKLGKSTASLPAGGLQAGTAQVTLVDADAAQLAAWLSDARIVAGLMPTEAHWRRTGASTTGTGTATTAAQWSGSVTLRLTSAP